MKLKEFVHNNTKLFLGILIGGIIFGTIVGASAATIIMAKEIDYSNALTSKTNVQDAIDELYEKLYAKKKLTINLNGGTFSQSTAYELKEGETVIISNPTRSGYIFNGWTVSGAGSSITNGTFTMGSSDATIIAKWTANTYTVTYNCNGGEGTTVSSSHTYDIAKKLTTNACYKITTGASGMVYQFTGWSTQASATTATYTDGQSVSNLSTGANVTLYAVWKDLFSYSGEKEVINDENGNWRVKFFNNGTYKTNYADSIDVFLVGGGGGGAAGGGGGGNTLTAKGISVTVGTSYDIVIGKGGNAGAAYNTGSATNGENTTGFGQTAIGGKGSRDSGSVSTYEANLPNGGSGGGGYGGGTGGSDGSDGLNGSWKNGKGQGTTTREFGDGTGTLYSGGGGGGVYQPWGGTGGNGGAGGGGNGSKSSSQTGSPGAANTGGGGGGGWNGDVKRNGGDGGSGIVVIRNAR